MSRGLGDVYKRQLNDELATQVLDSLVDKIEQVGVDDDSVDDDAEIGTGRPTTTEERPRTTMTAGAAATASAARSP